MLLSVFQRYINNYKGFSREIWILALVTFINRAGTMVLPFLSKYLKEDLHLSYSQIGWIMLFYGVGSMFGAWLGGKLSDKIGFYKVMIISLLVSGLIFFVIRYISDFTLLCISMFVIMSIADMFRPAMFVSLATYAKPENRTRALTFVRLAINLGFATGPALGGLIIMNLGYSGLFWADGGTCIVAILIFWIKVKEKKSVSNKIEYRQLQKHSAFKDKPFVVFTLTWIIIGIMFFQLFSTIPLYHKEQFDLSEFQTGLLLTFNGILVFLLEMPIVSFIERKKIDKLKIVSLGSLLMSISMFLLLANFWTGMLIIMMLFMTFAEMFTFPFANNFALSRAPKGYEGRYMAIFTMSFSLANIISSKTGMELIGMFNYQTNWIVMGTLGLIGVALALWGIKMLKSENS